MKFAKATNFNRKSGEAEGSAVCLTRSKCLGFLRQATSRHHQAPGWGGVMIDFGSKREATLISSETAAVRKEAP
jgi:hypothetical protein